MDASVTDDKATEINIPHETGKKKRIPKRVLHFSDGTLEEYSSDEDVCDKPKPHVDMKSLSWGPWLYYSAKNAGESVLGAVDYVGGGIAHTLGITSSKYFYEIEEYKHIKEQEEKQQAQEKLEMTGWTSLATESNAQSTAVNASVTDCPKTCESREQERY